MADDLSLLPLKASSKKITQKNFTKNLTMSDNQVGLLRLRLVHFYSIVEDLNSHEICKMFFFYSSFYCDRDHYGVLPSWYYSQKWDFMAGFDSCQEVRIFLCPKLVPCRSVHFFTSKDVYAKISLVQRKWLEIGIKRNSL